MAKQPINPSQTRSTIVDLRQRLDTLPTIDSKAEDYADHHRRYRAAADALADYLRTAHGAKIADKAWTTTIRIHSINSSGTSGMAQAARNWIAAAERKLAALGEHGRIG